MGILIKKSEKAKEEDRLFPLPKYKSADDIYNKEEELPLEEADFIGEELIIDLHDNPGEDLDIPGAEGDDLDEQIGEEDEENNYYSLGGDNHQDLEEGNDDLV